MQAEITTEDVQEDGEKLQYGSIATLLAQMPSKMRVSVEGEEKSRLFLYDGKSFTLFARRAGYCATVPAPVTRSEDAPGFQTALRLTQQLYQSEMTWSSKHGRILGQRKDLPDISSQVLAWSGT